LIGLKENIIIGKLIPAGVGMMTYRQIGTRARDPGVTRGTGCAPLTGGLSLSLAP
jgi:hypothetical protein